MAAALVLRLLQEYRTETGACACARWRWGVVVVESVCCGCGSVTVMSCCPHATPCLPAPFLTPRHLAWLAAGAEFDDEEDACFGRLEGIAARALGPAVDRAFLHRLVRAYLSLPFGGLYM